MRFQEHAGSPPSSSVRRVRGRGTLLVLASLCALVAAACGTRWSDDQEVAVAARYEAGDVSGGRVARTGAGTGSGSDGAGSPTSGAEVPDAGGDDAAAPAAAGGGRGSTPAAGAGAGGDGGQEAPADLPCLAPSDAPGVADDVITVGAINSLSGPVPGLGTSFDAAVKAYAAYRNATGGVCGRQVVVKATDDAGDNARNRSIVEELDSQAIAILPGPAGGGDGGAEVIEARSVPAVGIAIGERLNAAPTFYNINPMVQGEVVIGKYRYLREQGVRTVALVYIEQSGAEAAYQRRLIEAAGIEIVLDRSFPVTTLSYDSLARAVANSGADLLLFQHEAGASASMAQSMADTGHELKFEEYITAYGSPFIDLAGGAAEGVTSWLFSLPNEDGGAVPEQALFLEWMERAASGTSVDTFATSGWASAKVLLDSLEALPGPITRDALLARFQATEVYDAGGLRAPIEFGAERGRGCLVGVIVEGGRWKRLTPGEGFLC